MFKVVRSGLLAGLLAAASGSAVAASEHFVEVTDITFASAEMCGDEAKNDCVVMTGTITCAEEGPAELVEVSLVQRDLRGVDNLDLLDFACSTQPRTFTVVAEELFGREFRPGRATVTARVDGTVIASETIRIRPH